MSTAETAQQRVLRSIAIDANECWHWTLHRNWKGYGTITDDSHARMAHRFSYEAFVGPIPVGLHIDHLCRVRDCVNPAHLEPVTPAENRARGNHPSATALRTGRCINGHSLADAWIDGRGGRKCRECGRRNSRESARRCRAAAQLAQQNPTQREVAPA